MSKFDACLAFTLSWEGGYVNNPADPGGETKYGISKRAYPKLDIANLTLEQARDIYYRDYYLPSGADALPMPLAVVHFDSAVHHGLSRAAVWLKDAGGDVQRYLGFRLEFFTTLPTFPTFGRGWARRVSALLKYPVPATPRPVYELFEFYPLDGGIPWTMTHRHILSIDGEPVTIPGRKTQLKPVSE